jgi:hypothetical protein
MVKKKKEESLKETERVKEEVLHAQTGAKLNIKKLKTDDFDSSVLSGYDATDDSDVVFK